MAVIADSERVTQSIEFPIEIEKRITLRQKVTWVDLMVWLIGPALILATYESWISGDQEELAKLLISDIAYLWSRVA